MYVGEWGSLETSSGVLYDIGASTGCICALQTCLPLTPLEQTPPCWGVSVWGCRSGSAVGLGCGSFCAQACIPPFSLPCLTSTLRSTCHVCAWSSSWPTGSLLPLSTFKTVQWWFPLLRLTGKGVPIHFQIPEKFVRISSLMTAPFLFSSSSWV